MAARRVCLQAFLAAIAMLAVVSTAQGQTVTLGQVAPLGTSGGCSGCTAFQAGTAPGSPSWTVPPGDWTITSWSSMAGTAPAAGRLRVFRAGPGAGQVTLVAESAEETWPQNTSGPFATSIPVSGGDILGIRTADSPSDYQGVYDSVADFDETTGWTGDPAVGDTCGPGAMFTCASPPTAFSRINVAATLFKPDPAPPNSFSFGKLKRNKNRGTAVLAVTVPGPGEIGLSGKGLKLVTRAARPAHAKAVAAAGVVKLPVRATGKTKKKLKKKGKVKVTANVTFLPTGGSPATQPHKLKLVKKLD